MLRFRRKLHDFDLQVIMSSIKFTKEEAARFIIFPTSADEKVTFRTIKSGAKQNAYTAMLIEKTFDSLGVRIVCDDKSIGKKVTTISVYCKCTKPRLFHFQCATDDLQADQEIVFRILRKDDDCPCGLFIHIQGFISQLMKFKIAALDPVSRAIKSEASTVEDFMSSISGAIRKEVENLLKDNNIQSEMKVLSDNKNLLKSVFSSALDKFLSQQMLETVIEEEILPSSKCFVKIVLNFVINKFVFKMLQMKRQNKKHRSKQKIKQQLQEIKFNL
jgi:hypothetical protein